MTLPRRALLGLSAILPLLVLAMPGRLSHGQQLPQSSAENVAPKESVLLLNNGQVLRGTVTLDGDRYVVHSGTSEIRVPQDAVEHVCRSLAEGYQRKRAAMFAAGGRTRTRLIQWCLAQGMLDEAERELAEAERLDPNNLRYDLLRRQVKLAREPIEPAEPPAPPAEPLVSDAQLDILVRTLPSTAVESFSQTVQPLLLNNCAAAGCHGPSPRSDFQLIRLARGITPNRRVTQRNLHAALAWIDRDHPDASRLLSAAAQAHGNTQHHKFEGTEGPVFRHLAAWVRQVADPAVASPPSTVESSEATLSQSISDSDTRRSLPNAAQRNQSARGVAGPFDRSQSSPSADGPQTTSLPSTAPQEKAPADPFDPEVFNRRYHPAADDTESLEQ